MQTNKDHRVKKKTQAALKSLFGCKKTPASSGPSGSPATIQSCSPIADAGQNPPASSEPATSANALVGPPGRPSAVASVTDNAVPPSSSASLPRARQTKCHLELTEAIDEFRRNYVQFSKANREYILIDPESQGTCINMPISTHSSVRNLLNSSAYRFAPNQSLTGPVKNLYA